MLHSIAGIMRALRRIIVVASACLFGVGGPLFAQVAPSNTTNSAAPAQNGVVGNPQLQGFSLNGTATRTAPAPAPVAQPPRRTTTTPQAPPTSRARQPATPSGSTETRSVPRDVQQSAPADLSPAAPTVDTSTTATPTQQVPSSIDSSAPGSSATAPASPFSTLPWLVAAIALAGLGGWFFLRNRPRERVAGAGELFEISPESAASQPKQAQPAVERAPPAPAKPVPSGVVSTRLRPWLEIEFKPEAAIVDEEKGAIQFEVTIFNSGSAPARDVHVEGALWSRRRAESGNRF